MPVVSRGRRTRSGPASFRLSRWLFLRLLGLVFLIAFASFWVQLDGLIGSQGLLPARETVDRVSTGVAGVAFLRLPTLCLWAASDRSLHLLCAAGVVLALAQIAGVAPVPALFASWLVYLSLVGVGGAFMSFQWDVLLLEAAFLALFVAPLGWRPRLPSREAEPPRSGIWLLRLLLFKLMFLSGITKLLSMDPTWWGLTALDYHYFTQPLPTWTAWYAHRLPAAFDKLAVLVMFAIELIVPFCVFLPRRMRAAGALAVIGFQLAIAATGNYTFFNLLTAVLCLPLLDDAFLRGVGRRLHLPLGTDPAPAPRTAPGGPRRWAPGGLRVAATAGLVVLSGLAFTREMTRTLPPAQAGSAAGRLLGRADRWLLGQGGPLLDRIAPFRTVNGYGLFRGMTTRRPEILIEVSRDGVTWEAWEFRFKPGDPSRRPRFVAPHQPRLDWQMWFAALSPQRQAHWLESLARALLRGARPVERLLGPSPLGGETPRFLRFAFYDYRFTTAAERAASGAWWSRTRTGESRPLRAQDFAAR